MTYKLKIEISAHLYSLLNDANKKLFHIELKDDDSLDYLIRRLIEKAGLEEKK